MNGSKEVTWLIIVTENDFLFLERTAGNIAQIIWQKPIAYLKWILNPVAVTCPDDNLQSVFRKMAQLSEHRTGGGKTNHKSASFLSSMTFSDVCIDFVHSFLFFASFFLSIYVYFLTHTKKRGKREKERKGKIYI